MISVELKILEHGKGLDLPSYATDGSAALDLRAAIQNSIVIKPGQRFLVPSGICIELPSGYFADIRPRSGLAFKNGVTVLNTPGTIDSDYRGEVKVLLINLGESDFLLERGMRVAQFLVQKYEKIEWNLSDQLNETIRGDGGYGSTGIK